MTGVITSLPPLIEQPPGNNSSNPAGLPGVTYVAAIPILPQTWTGLQTFQPGSVQFAGSTSGFTFLNASAIASGTVQLPAITGVDTLLANANIAIVTNKSMDGLTNTFTNLPASSFGSTTGTGAVVLANTPSIVSPLISGATITTSTYNGNTWTAGTGILTLGAGKTATISNTLTFTGTDSSSIAFGSGGTVLYNGGPLGTPSSGVATNLTGTAAGLTAGNATLAATVTTNANLTGPVTSVGNATTIAANQITRTMEAQGIARSVIGVTGNATANVADIQGTASQFLGVNSAGTALAFQTMTTDVTLSGPAATIAANAVTNAKAAQMAAATLKGNVTASLANATDFTIQGLVNLAAPSATLDFIPIYDHVSGTIKSATPSAVGSAGAVSSVNGQTGALAIVLHPQGRLTLQTATPVMTTTQSAKTTLFYDAYVGNQIPIYDGTNMVPTVITAGEISVLTTDTTKSPAAIGVSKVNDWFVWNDAGTIRIGHGPDWTSDTARSAGTALVMVNGILLNNATITNGPAASRGTYVGTTRSNASSQLDYNLAGSAVGGTAGLLNVWNCYNRVSIAVIDIDSGTSYTYATNTVRQARGGTGNQISFVLGLQEDCVQYSYQGEMITAAAGAPALGVGFDTTSAFSRPPFGANQATSLATAGGPSGAWATPIGYHFISANEVSVAGTNTFNAAQFGTLNTLAVTVRN